MSKRKLTVSATGSASAAPDLATVALGVSVLAESVAKATNHAREQAGLTLAALKESGIAADDTGTTHFSIHPEWDHSDRTRRLAGYRVRHQIEAVVRDIARVGAVLDAAVSAAGDAATVEGVTFSLNDADVLAVQARQRAWENAKAKADQLAALAGSAVGGVLDITETSGRHGPPTPTPMLAAAEATPVEPGTTSITVSLDVTFELV